MRLNFLLLFTLLFPSIALSQYLPPFTASSETDTISVTEDSASSALSNTAPQLLLQNTGTAVVFYRLCESSTCTAVTTDTPILPGNFVVTTKGQSVTYIGAIAATGETATLYATPGWGNIYLTALSSTLTGIYSAAGDAITLNPGSDVNRLFTFNASSDTAHTMTFGDGSTADQNLCISTADADGSDEGYIFISGGGACTTTRGPRLDLYGNERTTTGGSLYMKTGDVANRAVFVQTYNGSGQSTRLTIPTNADADDVDLVLGSASTTAPVFTIRGQTGDADDDGTLSLAAGGAATSSRGGFISVKGNENSAKGDSTIATGDAAGSDVVLYGVASDSKISMYTGSATLRWTLEADGDLGQDATNGGNLVFSKDLTGIVDSTSAPAAAGSTITDATALTANVTFVTAADATKGVKFPAAPVGGVRFVIYNTANAVLKVWPGEATDNINANADGVNVAVAAYGSLYCHASSADQWWCGEMANP